MSSIKSQLDSLMERTKKTASWISASEEEKLSPVKLPVVLNENESDFISSVSRTFDYLVERERQNSVNYSPENSDTRLEESVFMKPADLFEKDQNKNKMGKKKESCIESVLSELQLITKEQDNYICIFCKSGVIDEINLGPLYFRDGVVTHYYCMLFSSALTQKGEDTEGILGFLEPDIMKEARRSFRLKCMHCGLNGASIGCCTKSCKAKYHYGCGMRNGTNFQFHDNYESFCRDHCKKQKITIKKSDWDCPICMLHVEDDEFPVMGSCCKNSVFHRSCLQKMALNAGYFFKCPTCNSMDRFVKEMRSFGIYVPEQDASWEKDNAFQELYYQYSNCDAEKCLCELGRNHATEKGNWLLARCRLCGASAVHKKCSKLKSITKWACKACNDVEKKDPPKSVPVAIPNVNDARPSTSRQALLELAQMNQVEEDLRSASVNSDNEANLAKLKLKPPASKYFPYTKKELDKFAATATLSDWRKLTVRVNLVRWVNLEPVVVPVEPNLAVVEVVQPLVPVPPVPVRAKAKAKKRKPEMNLREVEQKPKKRSKPASKWSRGITKASKPKNKKANIGGKGPAAEGSNEPSKSEASAKNCVLLCIN